MNLRCAKRNDLHGAQVGFSYYSYGSKPITNVVGPNNVPASTIFVFVFSNNF